MAFNPPLMGAGIPVGIVGEIFCLEREGISLSLTTLEGMKIKAAGTIFLTTLRICFVSSVSANGFSAIDIPFQGISGEDFKQPIFGANRLECDVAPVPGRGLSCRAHISLAFTHGGCVVLISG